MKNQVLYYGEANKMLFLVDSKENAIESSYSGLNKLDEEICEKFNQEISKRFYCYSWVSTLETITRFIVRSDFEKFDDHIFSYREIIQTGYELEYFEENSMAIQIISYILSKYDLVYRNLGCYWQCSEFVGNNYVKRENYHNDCTERWKQKQKTKQ